MSTRYPDKVVPAGLLTPPTHAVSVIVSVVVSSVNKSLPSGAVASITKGYTAAPAGGVKAAQFEHVRYIDLTTELYGIAKVN